MSVTTSTPALTNRATAYNYIDSLSLQEGAHKPVVGKELVYRYGRQDITGFMEMLGAKESIKHFQFSHYEQDRIHGVVRAGTAASAAAGTASGQLVQAAGYAYTAKTQAPYATADTITSYGLQQYDIFEVNGWQGYVTAVNGASATYYPVDSSIARPAIAATDDIIILTTAFPEGSSAPSSRNNQYISYTGYMSTLRRTHRVTNTEANTQGWVTVEGPDGKKGDFWYLASMEAENLRFMNEREAALLAGRKINNIAGLAAAGSAAYGDADSVVNGNGLIPQISANGTIENYTSGALSFVDIENVTKNLQKYVGSKKNMIAMGHDLRLDFNALLGNLGASSARAYGTTNQIIFNQFNGAGEQKVKFEFEGFSYGGFEFALQTVDIFSDPNYLGYSGGIYGTIGMVIPVDNVTTYNSMNAGSSRKVPAMKINYLGDRYYREWVTGFGNGVATTGDDFFDVHMLSQVGIELNALNRYNLFVAS